MEGQRTIYMKDDEDNHNIFMDDEDNHNIFMEKIMKITIIYLWKDDEEN